MQKNINHDVIHSYVDSYDIVHSEMYFEILGFEQSSIMQILSNHATECSVTLVIPELSKWYNIRLLTEYGVVAQGTLKTRMVAQVCVMTTADIDGAPKGFGDDSPQEFEFTVNSDTSDITNPVSLGYLQYYTLSNAANKTHTHVSSDITDIVLAPPITVEMKGDYAEYFEASYDSIKKEVITTISKAGWEELGANQIQAVLIVIPDDDVAIKIMYDEETKKYTESIVGEEDISTYQKYYEYNLNGTGSDRYIRVHYPIDLEEIGYRLTYMTSKIAHITAVAVNEDIHIGEDSWSVEYEITRDADEIILSEVVNHAVSAGYVHLQTSQALEQYTESQKTNVLSLVYPVNSIYWTATDTNPQTTLGFGTWEKVSGLTETTIFAYKRTE